MVSNGSIFWEEPGSKLYGLHSGKHTKSDMENGPVEIVDLPIHSMVIFPSVFCMFTRGYIPFISH